MIQAHSTSTASTWALALYIFGLAAVVASAHRRAEYGFDPVCDARKNVGVERVEAITQPHDDALRGILARLALVLHSLVVLGSGRLLRNEVDATGRGECEQNSSRGGSCIDDWPSFASPSTRHAKPLLTKPHGICRKLEKNKLLVPVLRLLYNSPRQTRVFMRFTLRHGYM